MPSQTESRGEKIHNPEPATLSRETLELARLVLSTMASNNSFKVIVVGGGPAGLTAALALARASIDFVLLERRPSIVIEAGSDNVLMPTGLRALNQLGLYQDIERIGTPVREMTRMDHHGYDLGVSHLMLHITANHGYPPTSVSRHLLTKIMYEGLPAEVQGRLHPNKQVNDVITTSEGVEVRCTDGTSYEGSIILGADGAHSVIRSFARKLALEAQEDELNDEQPFLTTYRNLWIRFSTSLTGIKPGNAVETHGQLITTQLFTSEEHSVVAIYERLDHPTRDRTRYTATDEDALVKRWAQLPITHSVNLEQVYASRVEAGMTNLEEGGCNMGIGDVVILVNELRRIPEEKRETEGSAASPTLEALSAGFAQYQHRRYKSTVAGCERSGLATARASWETTLLWLMDKYLMSSLMFQRRIAGQIALMIASAPIFDFIECKDAVMGAVPWVYPKEPPVAAGQYVVVKQ
ncbi:FAD-dependent monooxygenase sdnN [Paramyrothecium foliicola]|nr:FAD-dependent monooxygenase sdnN [Paramyrothecium foliicola]